MRHSKEIASQTNNSSLQGAYAATKERNTTITPQQHENIDDACQILEDSQELLKIAGSMNAERIFLPGEQSETAMKISAIIYSVAALLDSSLLKISSIY